MAITMIPERFPQRRGSAGHHRRQAVLRRKLRERQRANQEIVHAQDQGSTPPPLRTGAGTTGDRPSLFDQTGSSAEIPEESSSGSGLLAVARRLGRATH